MLDRKLRVVVMKPSEIEELMEDGADHRRVSLPVAVEGSPGAGRQQQKAYYCSSERDETREEIHGGFK